MRVEAQPDGGYRARLEEVPAAESALFAEALDEVLAPLSQPRYVIPRLIVPPAGLAAAAGLAAPPPGHRDVPATVVYHAVPTALSSSKKLAVAFERAWNARVGPGAASGPAPGGTGILAAQRGDDPFAAHYPDPDPVAVSRPWSWAVMMPSRRRVSVTTPGAAVTARAWAKASAASAARAGSTRPRREAAQRQRPHLQRADVPVREGQ